MRVSDADNKKNHKMEGYVAFCAHFWCVQVCEALKQHG